MKPYKMKPNTKICKGDILKLINNMVAPQPTYIRMENPSDFVDAVDRGEIDISTRKWFRHDYKVFKSSMGSRHFIGIAAESKISNNDHIERVLVFGKEDLKESSDGIPDKFLKEPMFKNIVNVSFRDISAR